MPMIPVFGGFVGGLLGFFQENACFAFGMRIACSDGVRDQVADQSA
jgi:hypothetical protein